MLFIESQYIEYYQPEYNIGGVGGGDNISNHPDRDNIIRKISESLRKMWDVKRADDCFMQSFREGVTG